MIKYIIFYLPFQQLFPFYALIQLIDVEFENPVLEPKWYRGRFMIEKLDFHNCSIEAVKTGAFNSYAFRRLTYLGFYMQTKLIYFEPNAFEGLKILRRISFGCLTFSHTFPKMLWGFENIIRHFEISGSNKQYPIQEIFGLGPFPYLNIIDIANNSLTELTPESFKAMEQVIELYIDDISLEVIKLGTFDRIAHSLQYLHICRTKLMHIQPELYYKFLLTDQKKVQIALYYAHQKTLIVHTSHGLCDCNYFWLKSLILLNIGLSVGSYTVSCQAISVYPSPTMLDECNFQAIHINKVCLSVPRVTMVTYIKFLLKIQINETMNQILIRADNVEPLHLVFILFNPYSPTESCCPDGIWKKANTKCLLFNKPVNKTWIPLTVDQNSFAFISIDFMTPKRVWPLHFITISPWQYFDQTSCYSLHMVTWISICVLGVLLGFLIAFLCKTWASTDKGNEII